MKISIFMIMMGITLAGTAAVCPAQDVPSPLTLAQCRRLAEKHNYDLKIQSERKTQAVERLKQARGAVLPNLAYAYDRSLSDRGNGSDLGDNANGRLTLSQPLFYGARLSEGIALMKSGIKREELEFDNIARVLNARVTQGFYALVQVESDITNVRETYTAMGQRLRELRERVRLGKSRESEVLMLEAQIASLRAQEMKLAGDRDAAAETLSLLTGVPAASIAVTDDTPAVDSAENINAYLAAVKHRSDIKVLRQDAETQSHAVNVAKGALLPALSLNGSWYTQRTGSYSPQDWDALFALNVPLFQGGAARGRMNEEVSRLREAEDRASYGELEAATEIRRLYAALIASLEQVRALKDAFEKTEKSYNLQRRDYAYGLVNNLDVIQSMLSLLEIKSSFDRAKIEAKSDKALLDIAAMR